MTRRTRNALAQGSLDPNRGPGTPSNRRLTAGGLVQLAARLSSALMGMVVAALLARDLGAARYGDLMLAITLMTLGANIGDFGLSQVATRELARRDRATGELAGAVVGLRLAMTLVVTPFCMATAAMLLDGPPLVAAVLVLGTLPLSAFGGLTAVLQARLRPDLVSITVFVQAAAWLAAVFALGRRSATLPAYGALYLVVGMIYALLTFALASRVTRVSLRNFRTHAGYLAKSAVPLGIASLFVAAYYRLDSVILFSMRGARSTAFYTAAYRFLDVLQIVPITVIGILTPLLTTLRERQQSRFEELFALAVTLLAVVAVPVAVGGSVIAGTLVRTIYGENFSSAAGLLAILLPAFVSISLGYAYVSVLVVEGKTKYIAKVSLCGAVVNIAINLIAIRHLGAAGAAWSTVVTEFGVSSACAVAVVRAGNVRLPWARWIRTIAATVPVLCVALLVRDGGLVGAVALPALSYVVGLAIFRPVTPSEIKKLFSKNAVPIGLGADGGAATG